MKFIENTPSYWKNRKYLKTMNEIKEEFEQHKGLSAETMKLVLKWVPKGKILDSGCGADMKYARYLKTKGYKDVVGCDFVDSNVENFTKCDVLDLKYKSESFDSVLSCGVLHHVDKNDRGRFFREHTRVLKKGGKLLIVVPRANSPATLLRKLQSKFKKMVVANYLRVFNITNYGRKNNLTTLALGDLEHVTFVLFEKKR